MASIRFSYSPALNILANLKVTVRRPLKVKSLFAIPQNRAVFFEIATEASGSHIIDAIAIVVGDVQYLCPHYLKVFIKSRCGNSCVHAAPKLAARVHESTPIFKHWYLVCRLLLEKKDVHGDTTPHYVTAEQ